MSRQIRICAAIVGKTGTVLADLMAPCNSENSSHWAVAAAVVVPCSNRKVMRPDRDATAASLVRGLQADVETAWQKRLSRLPTVSTAGNLYSGRGTKLARETADATGASLFVVSAGLGFVAADQSIPTYGLTVGSHGTDSIASRINGPIDVSSWWSSVSNGKFSSNLAKIFHAKAPLPILMALTRPYARMLASDLDQLGKSDLARLRITGIGLGDALSSHVFNQVLPYDTRLDGVLPGTKTDFCQRALLHFGTIGLVADPSGDIAEHRAWVEREFAGHAPPVRSTRTRMSDDQIIAFIAGHLGETRAIGRLLRLLRDREGAACEQARFTRLYRTALQREAA